MDEIREELSRIERGDETGYLDLIRSTKGFLHSIYQRYLRNIIDFDEWNSEALDVLVRSVQQYQQGRKCKFTTYFYRALHNRAMDIIRKSYTKKSQFRLRSLSLDELSLNGFDMVDHSWNQAQAKINFQDALSRTKFGRGPKECQAVRELFQKDIGQEQQEDPCLDYRKKRILKNLVSEYYR
ncbi:sigma factor [Oenococcus alcoholitolerans]|uniref:sigma factor n=1 Tax=Oenococcus alcoholitolerans TaxID=931074 RepID=UPI003F7077F1